MFMKWKSLLNKAKEKIHGYCKDRSGATAIMVGVSLPILIGATGMALDLAQAYLVRERLSHALDAAALAAAASATEDSEVNQKVQDFFNANYPPEKLGVTYNLSIDIEGDDIYVSAYADYITTFLNLLGISEITVAADASVRKEVKGLEVVLVLDYTGSMGASYGGKTNIARLQEAATLFINTLFERTDNPEFLKIGIVPYSTAVNVGPYGLGYDPDDNYYDVAFVNNPQDLDFVLSGSTEEWAGCVQDTDDGYDTEDHEGPWDMYRWCRDPDDDDLLCDKKWNKKKKRYDPKHDPNYICPLAHITPLTNDQDMLLEAIDNMNYPNGHTYGNIGMVWGWRVLSPEYPFTEGVEYDDVRWRKAIVMMTDGVNTMNGTYSAYGPTNDHDVSAGDLNVKMEDTCTAMKEQEKPVIIYTVTFTQGVSGAAKPYYQRCAEEDGEGKWFDAPDPDDLVDVFGRISNELSNLHIRS